MLHLVALAACAVAVYLACEWFVNAVEWLGPRLRLGPLAVGTVLAAFGTALPESAVTFVAAVLGGSPAQKDIGVGAAMGGPLALATVAYAVTGWMLFTKPRNASQVDAGHIDTVKLARDQTWFLVIFVVKVVLGLVTFAFKPWLGIAMFAAYAVYFISEIRSSRDDKSVVQEDPSPLLLQRRRAPTGHVGDPRTSHRYARDHPGRVTVFRTPAGIRRHPAGPASRGHRAAAVPGRHRTAGDHERDHLGTGREIAARAGEHLGRDDDPGDRPERHRPALHPLATGRAAAGVRTDDDGRDWLSVGGAAARAASLQPATLSVAGVFYLAFAALLIPALAAS